MNSRVCLDISTVSSISGNSQRAFDSVSMRVGKNLQYFLTNLSYYRAMTPIWQSRLVSQGRWMNEYTVTWSHPHPVPRLCLWPCRMSASLTAQGRTQGSMFTLSCASPSSLPSGTSSPWWSCIGTGARSPSTSATRRSVWPRRRRQQGEKKHHNQSKKNHSSSRDKAHRTTASQEFGDLLDLPDLLPWQQLWMMLLLFTSRDTGC